MNQYVIRASADDPRAREGQDLMVSLLRACEGHTTIIKFEAVLNLLLVMIRCAQAEMKADLIVSVKQALDVMANETPGDAASVH
jgi:hypothetical protein